jgi:hypothetical protein
VLPLCRILRPLGIGDGDVAQRKPEMSRGHGHPSSIRLSRNGKCVVRKKYRVGGCRVSKLAQLFPSRVAAQRSFRRRGPQTARIGLIQAHGLRLRCKHEPAAVRSLPRMRGSGPASWVDALDEAKISSPPSREGKPSDLSAASFTGQDILTKRGRP